MRSSWKLIPVEASSLRPSFLNKILYQPELKMWSKGLQLFSDLSDKQLNMYNGTKFVELFVKKEMVGHFAGSFTLTKRITADIHSKTKKNKRGRLNRHKGK